MNIELPLWQQLNAPYELYAVSRKDGLCKNLQTGKLLSKNNNSGYTKYSLYDSNGSRRTFFIHRLVYFSYYPQYDTNLQIDHIDGNPLNNDLDNLQALTAIEHRKKTVKNNIFLGNKSSKSVAKVSVDGIIISTYPSIREAEIQCNVFNVSKRCRDGKQDKDGHFWKYVEQNKIDGEEWKSIANHPNYFVSSMGRVKFPNGRITYGYKELLGYLTVNIHKKVFRVHRLVAEAFVKNTDNNNIVNHLDENKQNNKASNLQWTTYASNNLYSSGKFNKPIIAINKITGEEIYFESIIQASKSINGERANISAVLYGRQKTAYGYKFRFANVEV